MADDEEERGGWMKPSHFASRRNLARSTVYAWIAKGLLECRRVAPGHGVRVRLRSDQEVSAALAAERTCGWYFAAFVRANDAMRASHPRRCRDCPIPILSDLSATPLPRGRAVRHARARGGPDHADARDQDPRR
jgi:hypothetical protein